VDLRSSQATIFDNLRLKRATAEAGAPVKQVLLLAAVLAAAMLVWQGTGWRTVAVGAAAIAVLFFGRYVMPRFSRIFVSPMAARSTNIPATA